MNDYPRILYKYRSYNENTTKILTDGELFMPSISKFNDPFEGAIPYIYDPAELTSDNIFLAMYKSAKEQHPDWIESEIHEYVYKHQKYKLLFDQAHLDKQLEETRKDVDDKFGILCLTIHRNNFLMWSHYADNHKGLCIGFDTQTLYDKIQGTLGKMEYQEELPTKHLQDNVFTFLQRLLFVKSRVWEYEDEYRFVKMGLSNQVIKIPLNAIKEVVLGCRMAFEDKNKVIDIIKKYIPSCEIFDTLLSKTKFELVVNRIY